MQSFARVTKLHDIVGRGDYISNPKRQEQIVAQSDTVDWRPYAAYEQEHRRTSAVNNEGREMIVALPNEWQWLPADELTSRAAALAATAAGGKSTVQWAVHWNKDQTNLHMHVIFSERTRSPETEKTYDRDIYLTQDGKVARRKADRARDADGNIMPPIHRKGDSMGGFTAKDPMYARRDWLAATKVQLQEQIKSMGVQIDPRRPLHEYHEGKGSNVAAVMIRIKNKAVRINNNQYEQLSQEHPTMAASGALRQLMIQAARQGKVLVMQSSWNSDYKMVDVDKWEQDRISAAVRAAAVEQEFQRRAAEREQQAKTTPSEQRQAVSQPSKQQSERPERSERKTKTVIQQRAAKLRQADKPASQPSKRQPERRLQQQPTGTQHITQGSSSFADRLAGAAKKAQDCNAGHTARGHDPHDRGSR